MDTTSTAKYRGASAPLVLPPTLHVSKREPWGRGARLARALLIWVPLLGCLVTGGYRLYQVLELRYAGRFADSVLVSVLHRQNQYSRQNVAFAGSVSELKMHASPKVQSGLRVVSAWVKGRSSYVAEYCNGKTCQAIDDKGRLRKGYEVTPLVAGEQLQALSPAEGRFLATRQGGTRRHHVADESLAEAHLEWTHETGTQGSPGVHDH